MKTLELKNKLHHYIETAKEKKLQAMYIMLEEEIEEQYNYWQDEAFIAEMQKREEGFLNGTAKRYSIDEAVANAIKAISK